MSYDFKTKHQQQSSHARASCTLHMLDTLLAHSDTSDENMVDLFLTTWKMACENTACDVKYLVRQHCLYDLYDFCSFLSYLSFNNNKYYDVMI